nr:chemotaxis protein CheB [Ferrovum sp.]
MGANGLVILLTGMGRDGAQGMLQMRQAGAYTIAQDEATSVVYGMPRAAVEVGAVDEVLPLDAIARRVLERLC